MLVEWSHEYAGGTGTFVKVNPIYYAGEKEFLRKVISELSNAKVDAISELWNMHFNQGGGYCSSKPNCVDDMMKEIREIENRT